MIAILAVAPLAEELLFRGVILTGFLRRYGMVRAVVFSAILFAVIHLNPCQIGAAFFGGLFLGWLYLRTGSLWPCIAMHAIYNSQCLSFSALCERWQVQIRGFTEVPSLGLIEFQPAWFDAAWSGVLPAGHLGRDAGDRLLVMARFCSMRIPADHGDCRPGLRPGHAVGVRFTDDGYAAVGTLRELIGKVKAVVRKILTLSGWLHKEIEPISVLETVGMSWHSVVRTFVVAPSSLGSCGGWRMCSAEGRLQTTQLSRRTSPLPMPFRPWPAMPLPCLIV